MHLKNKTVVITGASRGIGRCIALKLASEGANIAFSYNSSEKEAKALLKELSSFGNKVKSYKVDVRDYEKVIALKNEIVQEFGAIDVLVNNAGIIKDSALLTMKPEDWKDVIDVNLTGVFNFSKAFIGTFMRQQNGHIINITSLSGVIGLPKQVNYSASKGGVIAFTKALAKEVAPLNIRVNAVAPGFIETDMVKDLNPNLKTKMLEYIPLKRFGRPEEVAELVYLLLNDKMGYITGQIIQIDGGLGNLIKVWSLPESMGKKRIVITGLGIVSPIGIGKEAFFQAFKDKKSGIKPITLFETSKYKVKQGGEITGFDPQAILGKRGLLDFDRATKLLLCSAKLAIDDSGLEINEQNNSRVGVSVGTTLGSLNSISRFNQESILDGPQFVNPSVFPNTVVNSPASRIGIKFKITGFNSTISTGMCSALDALEYACDFIDLNRVDAVLVGAVEDFSIQTFLGCYKLNYLSGLKEWDFPLSCPFDKRRNGIVLGEGATTFIVEDLENALKRKANIYAEILSAGSCFGSGSYYKYLSNGGGMMRSMRTALAEAELEAKDIDCIFANANSTVDADKIEVKAIKQILGKEVLTTSVKSFLGETFSASGGFSLAAAVGSLTSNFVPPVLNYSYKDPDCDLNFALNGNCYCSPSRVMINTFSPNGPASVAVIGKYQ